MAELNAGLASAQLIGGYQIVFEAVDPTTGAAVSGVTVSNVGIYADSESGPSTSGGSVDLPAIAPTFVPIPADELAAA